MDAEGFSYQNKAWSSLQSSRGANLEGMPFENEDFISCFVANATHEANLLIMFRSADKTK